MVATQPDVDVIAQTIGEATPQTAYWNYYAYTPYSYDFKRGDYRFWDKLRQGRAKGYEYSSALVRAAGNIIASYALGSVPPSVGVDTTESDFMRNEERITYTNEKIASFLRDNMGLFYQVVYDMLTIGDAFIIVNPDGSLVCPPPNAVDIKLDEDDYTTVSAVEVRSMSDNRKVIDIFKPNARIVVKIESASKHGRRYRNPIGRIPVFHFRYNPSTNEVFGHPLFEPVLPLLSAMNDIIRKVVSGVDLLANPIPVFQGISGLAPSSRFTNAIGQEVSERSYVDSQGKSRKQPVISFDRNTAIFTGQSGRFELVSPEVGFTQDALNLIERLQSLIGTHIGLPRIMWGDTVDIRPALAEKQIQVFERHVAALRNVIAGRSIANSNSIWDGLIGVVDTWLRYKSISDRRLIVRPLAVHKWARVSDMHAQMELQRIIYAHSKGLIEHETALSLLGLVSNPEEEVRKAEEFRNSLTNLGDNKEPARFINAVEHEAVVQTE